MALREVGLKFVADDVAAFIRDTDRAREAENRFVRSISDGAPTVARSSQVMIGAMRQVGALATTAFFEAGRAALRFAGDGIQAAGDFEAGMLRFKAVTGQALQESGMSLEQFSTLFLEMGAKTQFSAAQAQEAAINLAKGGIAPATIAAGALASTLDLAAAGELDLALAAEITAKQLGVWADQGVDAADVANLMAQAANASTVNVDNLALGLANVGGVAKVAGLSFEETVQTMALLSPGFSSAADAGTSFKTFLSNLIPTTKDQIKAMTDLGLFTRATGSAFYDAQGNFVGMEEASRLLQEATQDLSQEQKVLALETIFGSDAIRAAALIAEGGAEGFTAIGESMTAAGGAAEQAAARNQGLNFALESLRGSMETLSIVAGEKIIPVLTSVVNDALIPLANSATTALQGMDGLGSIVEEIQPLFFGATAAAVAYQISLAGGLAPALAAVALKAQAAAVALGTTLLPLAAIAASVYAVTKAYQEFNDKVETAGRKVLESRQWWNDSTAALENYHGQSEQVQRALSGEAQELENLRAVQEEHLESLGRRMAAGMVTDSQYQIEIMSLNKQADAIAAATQQLNFKTESLHLASEGSVTYQMALENMSSSQDSFTQSVGVSVEQMEAFAAEIRQIRDESVRTLQAIGSSGASFMGRMESAERAHQQRVADIIKGSGGGGGGSRVSASEETNKRIEELNQQTNDRLVDQEEDTQRRIADLEKQNQDQLLDLEQQTQNKLVAIDQKAAAQRIAELERLKATILTTYADLVAAQEANDLDLIGADEKRMAALKAREEAEATARAATQHAIAEANATAAAGDAALAQEVLKIRQESIAAQQRLDEEYARRQAELAGNPEALAALKQQYDEATAAIKTAEETKVGLARTAAEQHKGAAEQEKADVVAAAEGQKAELIAKAEAQKAEILAKAEEQKAELLAKAEEQKNKIIEAAQNQASATGGIQGQSIAERLAAEEAAYQEELRKQATAYALEQAEQLKHLGQMLINYVDNQFAMGKISEDKQKELTGVLRAEFGVQESLSEALFDDMKKHVDDWSTNTKEPISTFVDRIHGVTSTAIDAQKAVDDLTVKSVKDLTDQFTSGAIPSVEEFIRQLAAIPSRVETEVHTNYTESGTRPDQLPGERALGGPVRRGNPYIVGERGPEIMVPSESGGIIPTSELMQIVAASKSTARASASFAAPPASPAQIATSYSYSNAMTNNWNYSPTYSSAPRSPQQDFAIMRVLASA